MVDRQASNYVANKKKSKFAGALAKIEQDLYGLQTGGDGLAVGADFKPNLPPLSAPPVPALKAKQVTSVNKASTVKPRKPPTSSAAKH